MLKMEKENNIKEEVEKRQKYIQHLKNRRMMFKQYSQVVSSVKISIPDYYEQRLKLLQTSKGIESIHNLLEHLTLLDHNSDVSDSIVQMFDSKIADILIEIQELKDEYGKYFNS